MWWLLPLAVLVVLAAVVAMVVIGRRAHKHAASERTELVQAETEAEQASARTALLRELRPAFAQAVKRIQGAVRGHDARYGVPWYVLIGPPESGKTALVADRADSAVLRDEVAATWQSDSIAWRCFDGGIVIDVAGALAFPGPRGDSAGWQALLYLLKRFRPRRPLDGVLLAVSASSLLEEGWKARVHDLGASVRERLALAQKQLGFTMPVYVLVTQIDRVPGFTAFAEALPDQLRQNMLGWSDPHAADLAFDSTWIREGFDSLLTGLVQAQTELFASSRQVGHPSELFLFPAELQRLSVPLQTFLAEVFRPNAYQSACFFRGVYLCGREAERMPAVLGDDAAAAKPAVGFFQDLLDRKVFPERGLASPLPGASIARTRESIAVQIGTIVLAIVLAVGCWTEYARLQGVRREYDVFLKHVGQFLDARVRERKQQLTISDEERISQSVSLLDGIDRLSREHAYSYFYPTSIVTPVDPNLARILEATFGNVVLPAFKTGLEHRGETLFASAAPLAENGDGDRGGEPMGPRLEDSRRYRALQQFAADYRTFVENYYRYVSLTTERRGDLTALAAITTYLTGKPVTLNVPDVPYGQALRSARSTPISCGFAKDALPLKASALLGDFGTSWFGQDNPLRAAQARFRTEWTVLTDEDAGTIIGLLGETKRLAEAVQTWSAIGGRSTAFKIPVFDQAPFKRLSETNLCAELRPDLSGDIADIEARRDGLTRELLALEVEPFGPVLRQAEKGLALAGEVDLLKKDLDRLEQQDFWAVTTLAGGDVSIPVRPTWRVESLDQDVAAIDAFERFSRAAFLQMDAALRLPIVAAIKTDVADGVATRLIRSATEAGPPSEDSVAMLDDVGRLGTALTRLARLKTFLRTAGAALGWELANALDAEAAEGLRRLDAEGRRRIPQVFAGSHRELVTDWADIRSETKDPAEAAKRWGTATDERRENVMQLATLATPLVRFLAIGSTPNDLARRWISLTDDVGRFNAKITNNGLAAFDTLLRDGLPAIRPEQRCTVPASIASARPIAGFFSGLRSDVLAAAVDHCRELANSTIETRYNAIARAFNQSLAGRFPFTDTQEGVVEASQADVAAVVRTYDQHDGRELAAQLESRGCDDGSVQFLRRLTSWYQVLTLTPAFALDILPEFRANQDVEANADQIAEWQIDLGRQTLREGGAGKPTRWMPGDPVAVTLRFAKDSPSRPVTGMPYARVDDRTVRLEFGGRLALFSLLRAARPDPGELAGARDAASTVLSFRIPVVRDPSRPPVPSAEAVSLVRAYMRLRLSLPGKPEPVAFDEMPVRAPARVSCPK